MAFNNSFTAVTGATYTAAQYNTHVRDNFTAIWVYTTAGDISYATSATTLQRLGIGAVGSVLGSSGSAPRWVDGTRYIVMQLNSDVALAVGDGQAWFFVPPGLDGYDITYVGASRAPGGTGVPQFQIRNVPLTQDLLSTKITIDSGEEWSGDAATPPVINTANDALVVGYRWAVDVDAAGTNSFNCVVIIGAKKP